jgi:hypothetical protein
MDRKDEDDAESFRNAFGAPLPEWSEATTAGQRVHAAPLCFEESSWSF